MKMRERAETFFPVALFAACALLVLGAVSSVESGGAKDRIKKQWKGSPHAGSMDTPEEIEQMNKKGCAKCHIAQGYHEVILAGKESTAPYEDPDGLTCNACHHPFDDKSKPGALRAGSAEKSCLGCHNIVVTDSERNFSACAQGSIHQGLGGAEFAEREYPSGAHAGLEKGCVSCHMAPPPDGPGSEAVGGHTFLAVKGEGDDAILNESACDMCHGAISMETVRRSQQKFRKLLLELAELLPRKPAASAEETDPVPRFPKDPSLSDVESMAAFNYYLIEKDGTYGIHNPAYTRALLEESIAALEKEKK